MNGLRIESEQVGDHLLLKLEGELSVLTSYTFNQTIEETAIKAGHYKLVLDTTELQLIDSSGMGTLARLLGRLRPLDGCIHVVNIRANLMELLYVAKLDRIIHWFNSVDEALAACAAGLAEGPPPTAGAPASSSAAASTTAAGRVEMLDESGRPDLFGAALPAFGDCANYPTWYVLRWLRNNVGLRQRAAELIAAAPNEVEAAELVAELVARSQVERLDPTTLASGLYSFVLRCVDWKQVAGKLREGQGAERA